MKRREVWVCMYLQMKVWRMDTSNVLDFLPIFWVMTLAALFLCLLLSDTELSYKQILSINGNKQHRAYWLHTVLTGYVSTQFALLLQKKIWDTPVKDYLYHHFERGTYMHMRDGKIHSAPFCHVPLYYLFFNISIKLN